MPNLTIDCLITSTPTMLTVARQLADEFGMTYLATIESEKYLPHYKYVLELTENHLGLRLNSAQNASLFYIDFLSGKSRFRQQHATLRNELLAKALGVRPKQRPTIIDATAGLGRDSFLLASLGFTIMLIERSTILYLLLNDALKRAAKHLGTQSIIERMHLIHADARSWLAEKQNNLRPEVIYLDPMFPKRQKSAAVKKEMVILQDLLKEEHDADELLQVALTCATRRVVVKRPRLVDPLLNLPPTLAFTGKNSRFDVYIIT